MRCSGCRSSTPSWWWILLWIVTGILQPINSLTHNAPFSSLALRCRDLPVFAKRGTQENNRDEAVGGNSSSEGGGVLNGSRGIVFGTPRQQKTETLSTSDRRSWISSVAVILSGGGSSLAIVGGSPATATVNDGRGIPEPGRLPDSVVASLVFERILGSGSYKTVYLVSTASSGDDDNIEPVRYFALAVERLRNKREVKNAFRGVRIPERIRQDLISKAQNVNTDADLFEEIVDWWIQPSGLPDFEKGRRLFPSLRGVADIDKVLGRTRSEPPKNFAGSRWMLSFKPVYDTDLKRFIRKAPVLAPVGSATTTKGGLAAIQSGKQSSAPPGGAGDDYWTEPALLAFVLEVLRAGRLMHEAGIVHRDIKPKNLMIRTTVGSSGNTVRKRPVIIDYGFADYGSPLVLDSADGGGGSFPRDNPKKSDLCVVRTGTLKGEVAYVIAEDLAKYRGCQRGDAYAMGKTLYEFIFGSSDLQLRQRDEDDNPISVEGAARQNSAFRELLMDPAAGTKSRFPLSKTAADQLLAIVRGLCGSVLQDGTTAVLSFADAEAMLSAYISES